MLSTVYRHKNAQFQVILTAAKVFRSESYKRFLKPAPEAVEVFEDPQFSELELEQWSVALETAKLMVPVVLEETHSLEDVEEVLSSFAVPRELSAAAANEIVADWCRTGFRAGNFQFKV